MRPNERPDPDDPRKPGRLRELHRRTWWNVLKRTIGAFRSDNCTDWAAALTYYAVLSLFPAAIVLVALLGLFGQPSTVNTLLDVVSRLGPQSATDTIETPLREVIAARGTAGALLGVGLLVALWSASAYVGAFGRAVNAIYEVEEGRPFWKLRPLQILVTIVTVMLVAVVALALVVTGPLARAIGDEIGLGDLAVTLWEVLKWPVLAIVTSVVFAILYYTMPNVRQPRFRWFTPGSVVALVVWVLASGGFALYVANFGSYNKTYGSLGALIAFLVWLWISNSAILLGAELDAETERGRQLQAGMKGAGEAILLPPKQAAKSDR